MFWTGFLPLIRNEDISKREKTYQSKIKDSPYTIFTDTSTLMVLNEGWTAQKDNFERQISHKFKKIYEKISERTVIDITPAVHKNQSNFPFPFTQYNFFLYIGLVWKLFFSYCLFFLVLFLNFFFTLLCCGIKKIFSFVVALFL